ncbi:hypothetical protein HZA99_03900 [Candidatus Woesearchaeota archaeon]|nr:hypothetical protein [Candidatus Woesearchaeota archaeon]
MAFQTSTTTMGASSMVSNDFYAFRDNVDSWIKDFNGQLQDIQSVASNIDETVDNTNHNYELIQKMQRQMEEMQNEVKTIKLMQLLVLKRSNNEKRE